MRQATQGLMDQLRERGTFFDVREETVKTGSGKVISGKKVLTRRDDGSPLGIVSSKYKTVTTGEQFERFADALEQSDICLDGATAEVKFANNGARTMCLLHFPAHEIEVGENGKAVLRIVTKNSYDGRWKYSTKGGALRMACLNGMLLGDWLASYTEYHTDKLDVELAAAKVIDILGKFVDTEAEWGKMLAVNVRDEQAWRVFCLYANRMDDFKRGLSACRDATRKNTATGMFQQYETHEKPEIGANAFAVMNVLTHHATHANLRDDKAAIGMDLRQQRVEHVLTSKYWRERVIEGKKN